MDKHAEIGRSLNGVIFYVNSTLDPNLSKGQKIEFLYNALKTLGQVVTLVYMLIVEIRE